MPNILIVDDDELIRNLVKKSLIRIGYRVLEAENGNEAMEVIKDTKIALIIADMVMPEKGGLEILMEIDSLYPDMKKIAISGKIPTVNESIAGLTEEFGVDAVFAKPFEIFDMIKIIKSLVPLAAGK